MLMSMKTNGLSVSKSLSVLLLGIAGSIVSPLAASAASPAVAAVAGLPDFAELVEKTGPAVVNIRTTEKGRPMAGAGAGSDDEELRELFRRFFGQPAPRNKQAPQPDDDVQHGVGSGFIISADGYILSNAHVIDHADEVLVRLIDKREFKAKVIGIDVNTDVALLKIEGSNLPRLTMGDSNKIRVGEWVIAIGSPFDLDNTVTAGIISAKARDTPGEILPLIQTDVAVNPGNSGGPLINMRGEVIGINSQIYSQSGGYMGISFAVPIYEAMRVVEQLKATGRVSRGRMGVTMTQDEVSKDVAESLGMGKARGAQVDKVEPGSPAEKAGIQVGDIILKFNGINIDKRIDLQRAVSDAKAGSRAVVTVWRKGATRDITLVVGEMEQEKIAKKDGKKAAPETANAMGLIVSNLTEAQRNELKLDLNSGGVLVMSAEGGAGRAGLQAGDVILQLNNNDIKDSKQFNALVAKLEPKKNAVLLVRRGPYSQFVVVRPNTP